MLCVVITNMLKHILYNNSFVHAFKNCTLKLVLIAYIEAPFALSGVNLNLTFGLQKMVSVPTYLELSWYANRGWQK